MEPSSVVEIAASDSYGMLKDHNDIQYFHNKGDKENDECSNRGICDQGTGTVSIDRVSKCWMLLEIQFANEDILTNIHIFSVQMLRYQWRWIRG
jgi:hypothetical protein